MKTNYTLSSAAWIYKSFNNKAVKCFIEAWQSQKFGFNNDSYAISVRYYLHIDGEAKHFEYQYISKSEPTEKDVIMKMIEVKL